MLTYLDANSSEIKNSERHTHPGLLKIKPW